MASYDLALVFCTEAEVFAAGGYTWDTTSLPTDTQVYTFAQWACGEIVLATASAGTRYAPAASGISDVALRNTLVQANAVGAAYQAWAVMARGGDPMAVEMRDQLRERWVRFIGGTAANGQEVTGSIVAAVTTAATALAVRTDESDGFTEFPDEDTNTLSRVFTSADED